MAKKLDLESFINAYGPIRLANDLEVTRQAVFHWAKGSYVPNSGLAYKIVILSNDTVSFDSIYRPFYDGLSKEIIQNQEG